MEPRCNYSAHDAVSDLEVTHEWVPGVVINRLAAVRDTTGKVLIIRLVKVEAIRRHEYDIRYCCLNEMPEWRTKERLAEMRTLGGNASFSAEYTDGLIRSGHVLTTNTCWGYDYKGEHSMTVKARMTPQSPSP